MFTGQFHTPAVSAAQTGPGKSTKSSNELSRTRLWANRMSEDAKGTVLKRLNTSDHYHYKKWMDGLLRIPITSLHFHETDGSPLGISADYGVAAKMFKVSLSSSVRLSWDSFLQYEDKKPNKYVCVNRCMQTFESNCLMHKIQYIAVGQHSYGKLT